MTIVFKLSENLKEKVINYYKDKTLDKTPPYAIFQAKEEDTTITLYESMKIMFQGTSADIDANLWIDLEKKLNKREIDYNGKEKNVEETDYINYSTIGSDEVGTGDYFGPIVVCASFVSKENIEFLINLGVKDSKKLTDSDIISIAPQIINKIPHVVTIMDNKTYNYAQSKKANLNKIKAYLHNNAISNLLKKDNYSYGKIIIDEFCSKDNYYKYLEGIDNVVNHITFMTKAEDKALSVAASSIIARFIFLREIKKLEEEYNVKLPLGSRSKVDEVGALLVNLKGIDILNNIAKLNFKNTEKIINKTKKNN